jgi:hypothetical protein
MMMFSRAVVLLDDEDEYWAAAWELASIPIYKERPHGQGSPSTPETTGHKDETTTTVMQLNSDAMPMLP